MFVSNQRIEIVLRKKVHLIKILSGFPDSPVVKTPCYHCKGLQVQFPAGELRYHKWWDMVKKKKCF